MANEKISELPSGAPAQGGDALVVARGGANYSYALSQALSGATAGLDVVQIGGNTSGTTANISTGTMFLAGGNNVTLSQIGNAITISGASQGPTFSGGVSTGGNTAGVTGITGSQLVLAGGNNITLSQGTNTAGATITVSGLSPLDVTIGGNTTGTLALVSSGTLFLAGGNNVTLSQVGQSVTISAGTANPANLSVSAGSTSSTYGGLTFGNGSGVSFGLNNGTITASVSQSAQTQNVIDVTLGGNTSGALALISSGTMFLAGGNNITLSQNGNSVTISANTAAAATLSVSAGTTSGAFQGITFANANNNSWGLNNGTLSVSAPIQVSGGIASGNVTALAFSNSNNVSFGFNNGTVTASAAQTVQTQNLHDVTLSGNTAGALALISSGTLTLAGGANITLSQNGNAITISGNAGAGGGFSGGVSNIGNSAGNTGVTGSQLVLAGGNNITLSQVTGANGATVTVSAGTQTNQALGIYALSQTTGQSSSSTIDARSFSHVGAGIVSVGLSGASLLISASQSAQSMGIYASSQTTGQSSSQTIDARSFTVVGAGIISVGMSQQSLIISAPGSTGISQSIYATGNTTQSSSGTASIGSLLVNGLGGVSVGMSNGSLVISGATGGGGGGGGVAISAGTNSTSTGTVVFSNSNNHSFGMNTTGVVTVQAALNLYALGNTTQNSSTVLNITAVSFNGLGAQTVGYSNGSVQLSVPATSVLSATGNASIVVNGSTISVGANAAAVSIAGNSTSAGAGYSNVSTGTLVLAGGNGITLSQNGASVTISGGGVGGGGVGFGVSTAGNTAGSTGTVTTGNVVLVGSNAVSLSQSTGGAGSAATITINVPLQTNQSGGLYGLGHTTLTSSTTYDARSLSFNGLGAMTVGYSAGSGVLLSVPATSSLSATGWASVSVNGSTISIGAAAPQLSFFQALGPMQSTTVAQNGNGSVQVYPVIAPFPFTASRADMMVSVSAAVLAASTEAQTLSMFVGLYSLNGSTLSLATSGSQSYAWVNSSGGSSSVLTGMRRFSTPVNVNYTGGFDLFVGVMSSTTFANTNGISLSNVVMPVAPGAQLNGLIGETTNASKQFMPGQGFFSATSAGMPVSMGLSAISGLGSGSANALAAPIQFVNVTA